MTRRWTLWRAVAGAVAIGLFALAAEALVEGNRFATKFEQWQTAKPIDVTVDLSTPGQSIAPFDQTCSCSHSEVISLRIPEAALKATSITQLVQGLTAEVQVRPKAGTNVVDSSVVDVSSVEDAIDGAYPICRIRTFPRGEYEAKIVVTAGAPALRGIPQQLEGRYLLCGLEAMPGEIAKAVGIGSLALGLVIGGVACYRVAFAPKRCPPTQAGPAATS